jgi:carbon-monoxide dehydrogenase large subunit
MAAEEFKTSVDRVSLVHTDTARTYYEFGTVASRITINTGNALRLACQDAMRQLFELASGKLGIPADGLDIEDGRIFVKGVPERAVKVAELFTPLGYLVKGGELIGRGVYTAPISSEDVDTGQGKRVVFGYAHGATAAEVAVNEETGEVKVLRLGDCFDMGQPINPKLCEGQIEGGRAMGLGSTLSEEVVVSQGKVVTPNFMDHKMPTAADLPMNEEGQCHL